MSKALHFSQLSPARQILVRLCQSMNYGYLHDLSVTSGEPVIHPASIVTVDIKLDCKECHRQEAYQADFLLCSEIVRLMSLLDRVRAGKISKLEIRAGIPRRVVFENPISELGGLST